MRLVWGLDATSPFFVVVFVFGAVLVRVTKGCSHTLSYLDLKESSDKAPEALEALSENGLDVI